MTTSPTNSDVGYLFSFALLTLWFQVYLKTVLSDLFGLKFIPLKLFEGINLRRDLYLPGRQAPQTVLTKVMRFEIDSPRYLIAKV